ncbi:MAG: enoyl-CoA hydratase-related protein [Bacteroidota bacterium]|jgi:enoyl-CoA hydratase
MTNLLTEIYGNVLLITINRPDKLNALNLSTIEEIHTTLNQSLHNNSIKVIVFTGAGPKAFIAGADIAEFANFSVEQGSEMSKNGHDLLFNYIENFPKPIIAAINGFALGGGLELALSCHIRIASANAKLGFPELNLGVIPGYGGTQRLSHLVGKGKAIELILTTDMVSAEEAHKLNIVNAVCAPEELLDKSLEMANKISQKSPIALRAALKSIIANYNKQQNGFETEIEEFGKCFGTNDFKEGVSAFLEKRKPVFNGN